jgi:mono/diheme cytochrome c family protein
MRPLLFSLLACAATSVFAADSLTAAAPAPQATGLDQQFHDTVQPFIGQYCAGCHGGPRPTAQFDLKGYTSLEQVKADFPRWQLLAHRLTAHEMPPKKMKQPSQAEIDKIIAFVHGVEAEEVKAHGGDPGLVLARRLSNAEYDYTIRDLTGQDMKVARQFPVDPANQAGFDNSGESLTMSPALLNKYLQAARQVADNLVLTPDGIRFAPHSMLVETDREKYAIQNIIGFYEAQPTDFADYFQAAWRYRYRAQFGQPKATLASIAAQQKISTKYLPKVWALLNEKGAIGPIAKLQTMWNALPAPSGQPAQWQIAQIRANCMQMREFVVKVRAHTAVQFSAPHVEGLPGQSQPLHNWRLEKYAASHRKSDPAALRADNEPAPALQPVPKFPKLHADASPRWALVMANARATDTDLVYPAGQKARYEAAFARFADVFPDTFYVRERGRYWPDNSVDQGRLLSAGYHNSGGYYRDDTALQQLILDKQGQDKLNRLWDEFDFVADQTATTWTQYYFNQSGEVDGNGDESGSPRPEHNKITDTAVIMGLRDKYLAKAAADPNASKDAAEAIRYNFARIDRVLRHVETERKAAEPRQIQAVLAFAQRAYRRPLKDSEKKDLLAYYHTLREKNQLGHQAAIRDCVVSVLMSPDFLYRFDLQSGADAKAKPQLGKAYTAVALSPYSLASRLSYFLWSSMPDQELLAHAAKGDLSQPQVLLAETRRMLKDERMEGLATEFTGNWLVFRQFESNNSVDRQRFPTFDDDLREAMFLEPVRYMDDIIARDGSVLDLLYGDYTFVNPPLARHYGMPAVSGGTSHWVKVNNATQYGRGGILPMAVFMTVNSPGLRTSPVKRGNWVVQKVLGIRVPPPPPVVPELPSDEAKTEAPIRVMLAEHHKNPFCASCHERFDSFGLVFEGYGPVGSKRDKDLAGRPVDTSAVFPGGVEAVGVAGLKNFIRSSRQDNFIDNFSRKLLTFALNRSLEMSDDELVEKMKANLAASGYRFSALIETIVTSPQFLNRRAAPSGTVQNAPGKDAPKPKSPLIKASFRKAD